MKNIVNKDDDHEIKNETHCKTNRILIQNDDFPFEILLTVKTKFLCVNIHETFCLRLPLFCIMMTFRINRDASSDDCNNLGFTFL